jgi:hypothetical protein
MIDLGGGHSLEWIWDPAHPDEVAVGAIVRHPDSTGQPCGYGVYFENAVQAIGWHGKVFWKLESQDPITLTPDMHCPCGDIGSVTGGVWVPA